MAEHGFFHEGIAWADGDAVAAGDAGLEPSIFSPPSQRTRGFSLFPVDGEGLVDLHILAGFDAAAAEDALVGVVAVEGVGVVLARRVWGV